MFDVKNELINAFRQNKYPILISAFIFIASLILGYLFEPMLYSYFNPVVEDLTNKVQTGVIKVTFEIIFFNNLNVIIRMFVFGVIFCISGVILSFNGFFVGYYAAASGDLGRVLLLTVPHGIFEFSSCILSCAASFVLFYSLYIFFKTLLRQENNTVLNKLKISVDACWDKFKQAWILFIISIILMAVAGFIEVYLTMHIAQFFM